jgi:hypothetical protein
MKLDKNQVKRATKLHSKTLAQAKKAAIKMGWDDEFVNEVANLEWTVKGIEKACNRNRANSYQTSAILAVRDAAKFEMLGEFALSQSKKS